MTTTIADPETRTPPQGGSGTAPAKTAIATREPGAGVVIRAMSELWHFAQLYAASGMAPKGMNAEAIAVSIQTGMELGLSPAQSVQSIAVINGRPQIYGAAAQALVESSGLMVDFDFYFEHNGKRTDHPTEFNDTTAGVCTTLRRGRKRAYTTRFTVADAKRAGLWGKTGPWTNYPARMMHWRAVGHNLADNFGDVLKGLEAEMPAVGEITVITAEPAADEQPTPEDREQLLALQEWKQVSDQAAKAGVLDWAKLKPLMGAAKSVKEMPPAELRKLSAAALAMVPPQHDQPAQSKDDEYQGDQEPTA